MTAYIFTGPTLSSADALKVLNATYLPPVQQGDVYRVALRQPRAIGIIDGYFEGVPAVRHKEILWAMTQGIQVFGSASMGALRAAELQQFGMKGIGKIFTAYQTGEYADDDEVAVVHGQRNAGYAVVTEAMANIRATLAHAEAKHIISTETRQALVKIGKALFYKQRDPHYRQLLRIAAEQGLPDNELQLLSGRLGAHRVDQKRDDAFAMLYAIKDVLSCPANPNPVGFHFEHTTLWENAMLPVVSVNNGVDNATQHWLLLDSLFDELRLTGNLSLEQSTEIQLRTLASLGEPLLDVHLTNHLYNTLHFSSCIRRAYRKEIRLLESGILHPELDDIDLNRFQLLNWYFRQRLQRSLPQNIDRYAAALRFADTEAFFRALAGEYLYITGRRSTTP